MTHIIFLLLQLKVLILNPDFFRIMNVIKNLLDRYKVQLSEELMLKCKQHLQLNEIGTRRYFYPSLANSLPYLKSQSFQVTDDIAKCVLCLPLYYDLSIEEVDMICRLLLRIQNN